jgi:hypothetical protein
MPTSSGPNILGENNLVFAYDTGDVSNSYIGEPTTNLLPSGVAVVHDAASGNAVTVTDATSEKGPGWKKVTITARGSNFRTLQWTYLSMSANTTYTFSAVFDWGNLRGKNYFINFDGSGTGGRTYYRPGDYSNAGSELIDSTMPDGKFAGKILHSGAHTHSFFINNYTTGVSGLNDYFYYKEFQAEVNSHPTQFTTGTRSATQGLLPVIGNSTIDLTNVSFDSNAQMVFDGTDDLIDITTNFGTLNAYTFEYVAYANSGGNMPIASRTNTNFYKYGAYSWRYTHGGVGGEFYHNSGNDTGWAHWVITYDGSTITVYENNVNKGTSSSNGTADFSGGIRIGSWASSAAYTWDGTIPIMKMYNRALTAQEVKQNYQQYKTRFNLS